jgi:hypothetical protein
MGLCFPACLGEQGFSSKSAIFIFPDILVSCDQRGTAASYQQALIIETNNISFVYLFFAY